MSGITSRLFGGVIGFCLSVSALAPAWGGDLGPRPGWVVEHSTKDYATLLGDLKAAVRSHGMGVVTEAGPTEAARARGITLPGNRVVGVFRNDFAVDILALSTAAMIEAPIRFYVTEADAGPGGDAGAALAYKTPGHVFAPYATEGGAALTALAAELDDIFAAIAATALN
ncbi:hypothetical protein [Tritonibacter horizontis]|uniref:DUF302 domain-containing protein n=1 Tax=Tritonibacter horizontis TaxID=1768241 RepID=A0A132BVB3_9RHOB|nr:hypothetical protein [Tritonibacter horizontis]KUP92329.1 hypothetical protein TRIHO_28170 [Tritonibacter horizontis]